MVVGTVCFACELYGSCATVGGGAVDSGSAVVVSGCVAVKSCARTVSIDRKAPALNAPQSKSLLIQSDVI